MNKNNKNSEIANLVINYLAIFGINLPAFTDENGNPMTQDYLTSQLNNLGIDYTDYEQDYDLFLYLEADSDLAMLIDGETWHNNPAEDQDDYLMYRLAFEGGDLHIAIN